MSRFEFEQRQHSHKPQKEEYAVTVPTNSLPLSEMVQKTDDVVKNIDEILADATTENSIIFDARSLEVKQDISDVKDVMRGFYGALGLQYEADDVLNRNFHPAIDGWRVDKLRTKNNHEGLDQYKQEIRLNLRTSAMERVRVTESPGKFLIKDGQIFSEHFPQENFGTILARGAEYRAKHGSTETKREGELGEIAGWEKITEWATNRTEKTKKKIVSFSMPGDPKGPYTHRFVDIFEYMDDKEEPYIKRLRIAVDFTDKQYKEEALKLNPQVFDGYDGRGYDAWLLAHPLETDKEYTVSADGMAEEEFRKMYDEGGQDPMIHFQESYIARLYSEPRDWVKVALALNAFYNRLDEKKKLWIQRKIARERGIYEITPEPHYSGNLSFEERVDKLGRQAVATVEGFGCPESKGFVIGGALQESMGNTLDNSAAQFGTPKGSSIESEENGPWKFGTCRSCGDYEWVGGCDICVPCVKEKFS